MRESLQKAPAALMIAASLVAVLSAIFFAFRADDATTQYLTSENGGMDTENDRTNKKKTNSASASAGEKEQTPLRVAFVGNSILYYNDTPRFLQALSRRRGASGNGYDDATMTTTPLVEQDSCLRGGASLVTLLERGNGMAERLFRTPNAAIRSPDGSVSYDVGAPTVSSLLVGGDGDAEADKVGDRGGDGRQRQGGRRWDYVIMNDFTQAPAREATRQKSVEVLTKEYVPMLLASGATPVFLVTAAYRTPVVRGTEDLGDADEFTSRLVRGYREYAYAVGRLLPEKQRPIVAPVGVAYLRVREERPDLWRRLFDPDEFHPSPHGTYLQGCVLHRALFGTLPPRDIAVVPDAEGGPGRLWERARLMEPDELDGAEPLPLPTEAEADYLWEVAGKVSFPEALQADDIDA